jgi:antitoxin ParD1/3/4
MPTMNVSLPKALQEFVEKAVSSGQYGTASEVVRDGLRLLLERRDAHEERTAILKREVQRGIDQIDAGEFSELTIPDIWAKRKERPSG